VLLLDNVLLHFWVRADTKGVKKKLLLLILSENKSSSCFSIFLCEIIVILTQGSITGAFSSLTEDVTPSFVLLAVQDTKVVCFVYELVNGQVEVSKTEFTKKTQSDGNSTVNSALMQSLLA
jgi:vacuolar protein sorting-associated protein 29